MFGYQKVSKEEFENLLKTIRNLIRDNPTTCPKIFIYPDIEGGRSTGFALQYMIDDEVLLSPIMKTYNSIIESE